MCTENRRKKEKAHLKQFKFANNCLIVENFHKVYSVYSLSIQNARQDSLLKTGCPKLHLDFSTPEMKFLLF